MNPRAFLILVIATTIGLLAAIITVVSESRLASQTVMVDEPLFPLLVERANEVSKLIYRTPSEEAIIELTSDGWVFANKNNYPVLSGNVRSIVATIASLRRLEPKTDNPEKYARLAVEGVGEPDAESRELIFEASDGTLLAAVIIGKMSNIMQFDPLGGTYIREIGDAVSWLARGTVALPPSSLDFMERMVVHIPGPDIRSITIWDKDSQPMNLEKAEDENGVVRYSLITDDTEIRAADSAVKQLASGIVSFRFDDVAPVSEIEFSNSSRKLEFYTYKGMTLTLTIAEIDDSTAWVTFNAAAEDGSEDFSRAAEIDSATDGWAFLLPSYKRRSLLRDAETLVEPIPDPNAPAPGLPPGFNMPAGPIGRPTLAP